MYKINIQASIDRPTIIDTIPVMDWLSKIKEGHLLDKIKKARSFTERKAYQEYKATELPCVPYNALFNKYKKDDNITASTGLLYLDFDDPRFNISFLDTNKVFSYYKSLGGHAYAVLIKVEGLSKINYKDTVLSICSDLGVLQYLDPLALRIGQSSVLSYDPDLFLNLDSITFKAIKTAPPSHSNKQKKGYKRTMGGGLRFNNLSDYAQEGKDYVVDFENGFDLVKCHIPFKVSLLSRNSILLSYCNNLVWLNPFINKDECFKVLEAVNVKAFTDPVEEGRLHKIMNSIFRYKEEGTLKPHIFYKKRKISFAEDNLFTREEKLDICRKELAQFRTHQTRKRLFDVISNWDTTINGKISTRKIQAMKLFSKKTVDKYYKGFYELVLFINNF